MSDLERYQFALSICPVPMILADGDGLVVLANDQASDLFGYSDNEMIGLSVDNLVPDNVRDYHSELRKAYSHLPTKRKMGIGRDLFGLTKTKSQLILELSIEPITCDDKVFTLVTAIDISQRKADQARVHSAVNAASCAMVMCDMKHTITFANTAAFTLFGYDEEQMIGEKIELLVPDQFRRVHSVYVNSFMTKQEARSMGKNSDLFAVHRDGRLIPVEIALTPFETPEGKRVMSTIIDLTERVDAANSLQAKMDNVAALNTELSQFSYSASHDLKAPLITINGLAKLCLEDIKNNDIQETEANLDKIVQITSTNAKKIESVLAIASAGSNSNAIPITEFALSELLSEIWTELTGDMPSHVKLENTSESDCVICSERETVKVILINLLSNSLRYADTEKETSYVRVSTKVSDIDQKYYFAIEDNGIGLSEEAEKNLFTLFKKPDCLSQNGLGLTLVRKHVSRLGGSIAYESTDNDLTIFKFNIPISLPFEKIQLVNK